MEGNNEDGRITEGELKFATWWVRNRLLVKRLSYGSLIGACVLCWGYAAWGILDAYAISYPRESRITRDIAINQQLLTSLESDRPQNVSLSDVSVYQAPDSRYDMLVEVANPNEQWWVEFNYRFTISGEQTPMRSGYVLPQGRQILTELGYKPAARGSRNATLTVENVRWHRLDPGFVGPSYKDFANEHLNVAFENMKYDTDITLGTKKIGQTSFTLVNRSAYGYWNMTLVVRLYRGSSVAAINQISVENLSPGERRDLQLVWLDNLPSISRTEIIPQVNLLDKASYLPTKYFK